MSFKYTTRYKGSISVQKKGKKWFNFFLVFIKICNCVKYLFTLRRFSCNPLSEGIQNRIFSQLKRTMIRTVGQALT